MPTKKRVLMRAEEVDACLREIRRLAAKIAGGREVSEADAVDLAEALTDLDASLQSGGRLPTSWREARDAR